MALGGYSRLKENGLKTDQLLALVVGAAYSMKQVAFLPKETRQQRGFAKASQMLSFIALLLRVQSKSQLQISLIIFWTALSLPVSDVVPKQNPEHTNAVAVVTNFVLTESYC